MKIQQIILILLQQQEYGLYRIGKIQHLIKYSVMLLTVVTSIIALQLLY